MNGKKHAKNLIFSIDYRQYNALSVVFYNILLVIPAPQISSDKAEGIDSKHLLMDVYRVQNH